MNTIDTSKRLSLKTAGAGILVAGSGGIIQPAHAVFDPVSGSIIALALSAAISAIGSWFSNERRIDLDTKLAAANYQHYWMQKMVGDKVVTMDVAGEMYKNSLMTLGLLSRADKDGTAFHLKSGLLYTERGGYGDTMNAKEGYLAGAVAAQYGRMPVPLEPMEQNNLSRDESSRIRDKLENGGIDTSRVSLIASRRYSTARNPTADSPNVEMIAYQDTTKPRVNGIPQAMYMVA